MRLMEAKGYKCCIGNFGTGRPSLPVSDPGGSEIWTALLPMLRYAKTNGHILSLHEYGYTIEGWNLGRYRKVYNWLPQDARPSLVVSEMGIDGAQGRFRDTSWRIRQSDPDEAYMALLRAYDAFMTQDAYTLGFTVFTLGTNNSSGWNSFDIAGQPLISKIISYLKTGQHNMANEPAVKNFQHRA